MNAAMMSRMKELEAQNARLRKMYIEDKHGRAVLSRCPSTKERSTGQPATSTIDVHSIDNLVPMLRRRAFAAFLFAALFGDCPAASDQSHRPPGPVMMVHFDYYPQDMPRIHALERRLESAIKRAGVGELGETEFHLDGNDGYFYMYGADPDRMYTVVSPILKSSRLMSDAEVTKHYGSHTQTAVLHRDGEHNDSGK